MIVIDSWPLSLLAGVLTYHTYAILGGKHSRIFLKSDSKISP